MLQQHCLCTRAHCVSLFVESLFPKEVKKSPSHSKNERGVLTALLHLFVYSPVAPLCNETQLHSYKATLCNWNQMAQSMITKQDNVNACVCRCGELTLSSTSDHQLCVCSLAAVTASQCKLRLSVGRPNTLTTIQWQTKWENVKLLREALSRVASSGTPKWVTNTLFV